MQELKDRIAKSFKEFTKTGYDNNWSDKIWTHEEKEMLTRIGNDLGFLVFPQKYIGIYKSEWLFDIVWVEAEKTNDESLMHQRADNKQPYNWMKTKNLYLACESEWSSKAYDILDDFYKLTFSSANLRLFVYTNKEVTYENRRIHPVDLCKGVCPENRNFEYMMIGIPSSPNGEVRIDEFVI